MLRVSATVAVGDRRARLQAMNSSYAYEGEQTCAADGMCQEKCPVKINTGDLIKVWPSLYCTAVLFVHVLDAALA